MEAAETGIRRHIKVRGDANPYDPAWELYFEERLRGRMAQEPCGSQGGSSPCGSTRREMPGVRPGAALTESWHLHHKEWRMYGGSDALFNRSCYTPIVIVRFTVRELEVASRVSREALAKARAVCGETRLYGSEGAGAGNLLLTRLWEKSKLDGGPELDMRTA